MWILTLALIVLAGWAFASVLLPSGGSRGAELGVSVGLGTLFGCGLFSALFFGCIIAGVAGRGAALSLAGVLTLAGAGLYWKQRANPLPAAAVASGRFPWTWLLWCALGIAVTLLALDFRAGTIANPEGDWDAGTIWNLRARFLSAGPGLWQRAINGEAGGFMLGASHPGYPLFLSSLIAGLWTSAGGFPSLAPESVSLLFAAALLLLLSASLAWRKSTALGLLAALVLTGTEVFASQASSQYSDLLLAMAFLAALVALDAAAEMGGSRLLLAAGLAIGFAPWIKNEGQPFAIAALAVALWRFRGRAGWVIAGAVPGMLATAALKLMAGGRELMFPSTMAEALSKISSPGRWLQIAAGFGGAFVDAGPVWAHPVLLVVVLALALKFVSAANARARIWLAIPIAGALAAEFGLYLITAADLTWHLSTSVTRLVVQVWPSIIWFVFMLLRTPESFFPQRAVAAVADSGAVRGRRKKRN